MLMRVLGIETSCDETALALLESRGPGDVRVLAEKISSQTRLHAEYGGVVPELAAREHMRNLPLLLDQILESTSLPIEDLSAVGVTCGPGLKGCLLTGLSFAKGLCFNSGAQLVGVNHIEGHILVPLLDNPGLTFPYLCLVVSGGHTEIHVVHGLGRYELLARTIDDAAGEAFDKSANLLGFEYPGGARLAALADSYSGGARFQLPRVMREAEGFSFSGLKTAITFLVRNELGKSGEAPNDALRGELASSIQDSILDALMFKLKKAIDLTGLQKIVVTGGVSANRALRERVQKISGCEAYFPTAAHSTDNGAMIAYAALLRLQSKAEVFSDFDVLARWPVEQLSV